MGLHSGLTIHNDGLELKFFPCVALNGSFQVKVFLPHISQVGLQSSHDSFRLFDCSTLNWSKISRTPALHSVQMEVYEQHLSVE